MQWYHYLGWGLIAFGVLASLGVGAGVVMFLLDARQEHR